MKKNRFLIISIVIIFIGFVVKYYLSQSGEVVAGSVSNLSISDTLKLKPIYVKSSPAFIGELIQYISVSGTTEACQETQILSRVNASIKNFQIEDGTSVKKGDTLLIFDDREYQYAFTEARSTLLRAQIEYALLKKDLRKDSGNQCLSQDIKLEYEKKVNAHQAGLIDDNTFRSIERDFQIARIFSGEKQEEVMAEQSGLTLAESRYNKAEFDQEQCVITAPFDGIIGDCQVHQHDYILFGQSLFRLVNLENLKLKLEVLETDISHVQKGESVIVRLPAMPDRQFEGFIIGINPMVDYSSHTCLVIAAIKNSQLKIKSGMMGIVQIVVNRHPGKLLVPKASVLIRDQRKLVFIMRDSRSFWCYVKTGQENDDYIEIIESDYDLRPGEPVIVEGHFALAHDVKVVALNDK